MAFYKNGIIGAEGEYDTGKMVGKWKFRNSDGSER
jgi:antitoxin component YwqK of YwqJK toxin-antitoxin module